MIPARKKKWTKVKAFIFKIFLRRTWKMPLTAVITTKCQYYETSVARNYIFWPRRVLFSFYLKDILMLSFFNDIKYQFQQTKTRLAPIK